MKLEIRAVLAGAYANRRLPRTLHTHAVEVDDAGREVSVLCTKVKLDSLADAYALTDEARRGAPSCPACLPKWLKGMGR